jgi:hypothetical protein
MLDISKKIIGDSSMVVDHFLVPHMLILYMLIPPLLLCLHHLHSCLSILLMIQISLVLRVLDRGYLDNILVIPAKDQVDMGGRNEDEDDDQQ